jgi:hypothetical protein
LAAAITSNFETYLKVTWSETPDTHGNAVTSYTITIKQNDGVYSEVDECYGDEATIVSTRTCSVSMSVLRGAPFNLALGTLIQVTITATNDKGRSDSSPLNIVGAIVQNIPQTAPVPSRGESTDASSIEVIWSQMSTGLNQGYAAVTGYKIYWDDSGDFALRVTLGTVTTYSEAGVT